MSGQRASLGVVKALLLENIHPDAHPVLAAAGIEVATHTGALGEDELIEALVGVDLLGLRSTTNLTRRVLESTDRLQAVGAFCIGTNQIDLAAAAERGVAAFNAPFSNTRSVVELVIGEIIALARRLPEKTERMHAGVWDKSAKGSHEIRRRTLGIVGYGNIGSQLSVVAEALGMRTVYYDTADRLAMGNATKVETLDELLAEADVVSLHVDGRPGNAGIFGDEQFRRMKPRSLFINAARGMVVDTEALRDHIVSGHIAGAALDVFPIEPKKQGEPFESVLRGLDNVILTPHVGGSTMEAQAEIGGFVARKLTDFVTSGGTQLSVNLPEVNLAPLDGKHRVALLHRNEPGVLAELNRVLLEEHDNVFAQDLSTRGELGYVVSDISEPLRPSAAERLRALPQALWLRTHA